MRYPMRKAFTLVELMVVLMIVAILAAFTLPQFSTTINRSRARSAVTNVAIIHAANALYRARHGFNTNAADLGTINTTLGLNIIGSGATYSCSGATQCQASGTNYTVTGVLANPLTDASNPSCAGTNCPPSP